MKMEEKYRGMVLRVEGEKDEKEKIEEQLPENNRYCDVCGIDMMDEDGNECVGISFNFDIYEHKEAERVFKIFGKQEFRVCFVCWMKALGVKPIEEGGKKK